MGSTPLGGCIKLFLKNLLSNFRLHIKDSKWGRKCIFMNYASHNGSPQEMSLRQLPFANEAKPHSHCRAFWAWSQMNSDKTTNTYIKTNKIESMLWFPIIFKYLKSFLSFRARKNWKGKIYNLFPWGTQYSGKLKC